MARFDKQVTVYLSEEQINLLGAFAEKMGMKLATFVRVSALAGCTRLEGETEGENDNGE